MTDVNQSENEVAEEAIVDTPKPGEQLRAQREALGLSHASVAETLHLTVHYIKALENNEYSKLPGLTFVKGYIRTYSRFLNMDVDSVLACYEDYLKELGIQVSEQENSYRMRKRNDQAVIWAVIAGLILAISLFAGWWFFGRSSDSAAVSSAAPRSAVVQTTRQSQTQNSAPVTQPETVQSQFSSVAENALADPSAAGLVEALESPLDSQADSSLAFPDAEISQSASIIDLEAAASEISENTSATVVPPLSGSAALDESENDGIDAVEAEAEPNLEGTESLESIESLESTDAATTNKPNTELVLANGYTGEFSTTDTGTRQVRLFGAGHDLLQLTFKGTSWVEVDDAEQLRLYNDLMKIGDALTIQGDPPFYVLLGDATQVDIVLNADSINFNNRIRADKSARFIISNEGASRWVSR